MADIVLTDIMQNNIVKAKLATVKITGPNYATGGHTFTPDMVGMNVFHFVSIPPVSGYVPIYDWTNQKIMMYWSNSSATVLAQITNATDLTGVTFYATVIGR